MPTEMTVAGLAVDPSTNMPILVLRDLEGRRALPIWVGVLEASAIATELGQVKLARPMTHDLMKEMLDQLGATVIHVEVSALQESTYFATIVVRQGARVLEIDARPSDAIALALRVRCKILVADQVLEAASVLELELAPLSDAEAVGGEPPEGSPGPVQGKWKM